MNMNHDFSNENCDRHHRYEGRCELTAYCVAIKYQKTLWFVIDNLIFETIEGVSLIKMLNLCRFVAHMPSMQNRRALPNKIPTSDARSAVIASIRHTIRYQFSTITHLQQTI